MNVVTKTAYVDHDIALCSTQQISDALNQSKMGASVVGKAWGGAAAAGDCESKTGGGQRRGGGGEGGGRGDGCQAVSPPYWFNPLRE